MIAIPERWVVLIIDDKGQKINKVFAGWYGGYLGSDSWQLNSGNVSEEEFNDRWEFTGSSGSVYVCHKRNYGMSRHMSDMLAYWAGRIQAKNAIVVAEQYQPDKVR